MRVGLMGCVRRVWAPVGIKLTQAVEYTREWAYLHLAVNGLKGKLMWAWSDNMKAESIVPVVKQWSRRRVKFLVWDRARGHRGPLYDTVRLQRIEQPPYSPELNPPERVFEYLRAAVEGKVYGTLAAKKEAIETALNGYSPYQNQLGFRLNSTLFDNKEWPSTLLHGQISASRTASFFRIITISMFTFTD